MREVQRLTIAIDGPAGAGKSTIARIVADRLGYLYIDTGAMYRALSLKALRMGIDPEDDVHLAEMTAKTKVRLVRTPEGEDRVMLDDQDVTREIRTPAVSRIVSRVSAVVELRRHMVALQREMAAGGGVVMDGRDIGSHVLPNADRKFFVTASLRERALRRQRQLDQEGHQISLSDLEQEIAVRDERDQNKGEGSLLQTTTAILIDTTGRKVDEVVDEILAHCRRG